MFVPAALAVAATVLPLQAAAEGDFYTVWSSVIFSRTGERTPEVFGGIPTTLTSLGAQQQYAAGSFFRNRYLGSYTENGVGGAPIQGLGSLYNVEQMVITAIDEQYTVASAQAFMQGLYPPIDFSNDTIDMIELLDPTAILANSSYLAAPLNNYQYPLINSVDPNEPEFVYLAGYYDCPGFDKYIIDYELSQRSLQSVVDSESFYLTVGAELLGGVIEEQNWNAFYAYSIYDYVNYQSAHNASFAARLNASQYPDALDRLRYYADQQQFGWYGNIYAANNITSDPWPGAKGSISTISGNFLASQMLGMLQQAVNYKGELYKLNLLFGDFQPLMSLFALMDLPPFDSNFYGLPDFASVAAFELYSWTDGAQIMPFPNEDDLYVRFVFANGTIDDSTYLSRPLFNWGPDQTEMRWSDFEAAMLEIIAGSPGDWCNQCGAGLLFCAYWNASDSLSAEFSSSPQHHHISPAIGGVIGALLALVVAALIFAAGMLCCGVRVHRVSSRKSEVGGYKGSQKLASDKDLVLPKGAIVGATVEEVPGSPVRGGHERVGSWELKQNEAGMPNIMAPHPAARRPSYEHDEHDDVGPAPWREPVKADERV